MNQITKRMYLNRFVTQLIRDYKVSTEDGYCLDVASLPKEQLMLFASHIIKHDSYGIDPWSWLENLEQVKKQELAEMFSNILNYKREALVKFFDEFTDAALKELIPRMKKEVNSMINFVESEDKFEQQIELHHRDNGDTYWSTN